MATIDLSTKTGQRNNGRCVRTRRQGTAVLAAIIVLLVVMMLSVALARGLATRHRHIRVEQQRQQAAWLADSALQRALVRLKAAEDYSGETWQVSVDVDNESLVGVAEIAIFSSSADSSLRIIRVEARWPDHPLDRTLEQRQITISVPDRGATS